MTRRTSGNYRKRGAAASRHHLLELNVRTASQQRQRRRKAGGVLWKIFASLVVLVLIAIGLRIGAQKFFFQNADYSLHHLNAHLDGVITQEELVAMTGFDEGRNLLSLDLDQANKKLSALPEVMTGSVSLERVLPDTISVKLARRIPVFLLVASGDTNEAFIPGKSFLCDTEGILMQPSRLNPEFLNLPILRGVDVGTAQPGSHLENDQLDFALQLRQVLSEFPEESFKIRSVDVSKEYAAVVTDSSNARYTFGTKDLRGQIERLKLLLTHCQETGRPIDTANLMVERNTPVTFVMTAENPSPKITPVPTPKKSVHRSTHH
jgi:cell division septal protein FtsQ